MRAPRYGVAPSEYHRVAKEGISKNGLTSTNYYHLAGGGILAMTVIGHGDGSSADVYESFGNVVKDKHKNGKEYEKFLIGSQIHLKEPKGGPLGKYWDEFVAAKGGKEKVMAMTSSERMKSFWTWYKNPESKTDFQKNDSKRKAKKAAKKTRKDNTNAYNDSIASTYARVGNGTALIDF